MFNRIAPSYDKLNRILSGGIDRSWRKKAAEEFRGNEYSKILDVATGTGDLLFAVADQKTQAKEPFSILGVDKAENLLEIAMKKAFAKRQETAFPGDNSVRFQPADGTALPFGDNSFDGVCISFGIRNMPEFSKALREFYRILRPGGKAVILEFSLPRNRLVRSAYLLYFRKILPLVGGWISGDKQAYMYLNRTVEGFPYGEEFCERMRQASFSEVRKEELTFGIATKYVGIKTDSHG